MRIAAAILLLLLAAPASGRDDGRHAGSPLKPWFDRLSSGKGLCCSVADGRTIVDSDWESKGGHYRVRLPTGDSPDSVAWVDVPDDAVVTDPNLFGRTMVWPFYIDGNITVRCFMPGAAG